MTRPVVFSPEAQDDLRQLTFYIAERSGTARAIAYLERIEAWCFGLHDFPERGARRDDLWPGLRTLSFDRRFTVASKGGDHFARALRRSGPRSGF